MKIADFNRLKKLMPMTQSDVDQEALTAVRMANKILRDNGVDWERVFARLVSVDVEEDPAARWERADASVRAAGDQVRQTAEQLRKHAYLDELLAEVADSASGNFIDFVASLREQFDRTGHLTPLQISALEKSRLRSRRG